MDNRRVLIAVLLSLAVLIGWQQLFPASPPGQAPVADQPVAAEGEGTGGQGGEVASTRSPGQGPEGVPDSDPTSAAGPEETPEQAYEPLSASREEEVVVETDLYRAVLTNRGGQLVSFVLGGHESHDGNPVDLVRSRADGPYPYAFVDRSGHPLSLNGQLFTVEREVEDGTTSVTFRYSGPEGIASKRFDFRGEGLFDVTVEVARPERWALFIGPGIRNPSLAELENRFERRAAVYRMDGDVENLDTTGTEERISLPAGSLEWVGLEDTYFLSAIIPLEPVGGVVVAPYLLSEGSAPGDWSFRDLPPEDELSEEEEEAGRDLGLIIRPDDGRLALTSYWGAKKYQRLSAMEDYGLEETITIWSLLRPIAVPLLWALVWVYENVVHNYGWAIVLVTIVIKLILLPLTHKSFVSMRKMQELNPQMQAIRSKWRGKLRDKQGKMNMEAQRKMNEEMQELYREAGVNPVGGCLPMLLQMPVLFAFYQLLTTAVELRGAPWLLWITDLSRPSFVVGGFPFEPLALVMGVTQVIQQRLTPMAGDPMQRKLMQAMPILFTLFFLGFPSGLVLYWLTNNLLTILQHSILQRTMSKKDDQPASGASKRGSQKGSKSSRRVAKK